MSGFRDQRSNAMVVSGTLRHHCTVGSDNRNVSGLSPRNAPGSNKEDRQLVKTHKVTMFNVDMNNTVCNFFRFHSFHTIVIKWFCGFC